MRLTEQQRATLKEETAAVFGPQAQLRLFGSRVDDNIKGGDPDMTSYRFHNHGQPAYNARTHPRRRNPLPTPAPLGR
jgi:hypothetical protein